jgi:hypothetical protein
VKSKLVAARWAGGVQQENVYRVSSTNVALHQRRLKEGSQSLLQAGSACIHSDRGTCRMVNRGGQK